MVEITPGSSLIDQLNIQKKQAEETKGKNELGQKEFLDLMIAQFQNQSPTEPMENGDFIAQMAQFSTVSGLDEIKKSLDGLGNALVSNQALQASSMVGREVLTSASGGYFSAEEGKTLAGAVELPQSTNDLTIAIHDSAGQLIKRMPLGDQAAGMVKFNWDGKNENGEMMPAGTYQVKADINTGNERQAVKTFIAATVESVSMGGIGQKMSLNVVGQGAVNLDSVREIF